MAYIEFSDVMKIYGSGGSEVHALDGASFEVERGELAVILGASGAGQNHGPQHLGRHGHRHERARDRGRSRCEPGQ